MGQNWFGISPLPIYMILATLFVPAEVQFPHILMEGNNTFPSSVVSIN